MAIVDNRPMIDPELEWEADRSAEIHLKKHASQNTILPGYGRTEFGVSSFESKSSGTKNKVLLGTGVATLGLLAWRFTDTLVNYALLRIESSKN